jgi:hypothetical protein
MPLEIVLNSKALIFCSGTVERAIWLIACRFWASGASLDGFDELTARNLAKLEGAAWDRSKVPVMAGLNEILPALARAREIAIAKKANMKFVLGKISADTRAARYQSAKPKTESKPEIKKPSHNPIPLVTPAHARAFDNGGKTMLTPQQLAAISSKTDEVARLVDK